jgi:hypothetical protein
MEGGIMYVLLGPADEIKAKLPGLINCVQTAFTDNDHRLAHWNVSFYKFSSNQLTFH